MLYKRAIRNRFHIFDRCKLGTEWEHLSKTLSKSYHQKMAEKPCFLVRSLHWSAFPLVFCVYAKVVQPLQGIVHVSRWFLWFVWFPSWPVFNSGSRGEKTYFSIDNSIEIFPISTPIRISLERTWTFLNVTGRFLGMILVTFRWCSSNNIPKTMGHPAWTNPFPLDPRGLPCAYTFP